MKITIIHTELFNSTMRFIVSIEGEDVPKIVQERAHSVLLGKSGTEPIVSIRPMRTEEEESRRLYTHNGITLIDHDYERILNEKIEKSREALLPLERLVVEYLVNESPRRLQYLFT